MNKKRILHVIDSLGNGGAEVLLVNTIQLLPQFEHFVVYLFSPNQLGERIPQFYQKCLHLKGPTSFLQGMSALKSIIKEVCPDIVHSHLFYANILSRISTPKNIKLINSYHNLMYDRDNPNYSWKFIFLDSLTFRKEIFSVYVSETVKNGIENRLGYRKNCAIVNNFVADAFFEQPRIKQGQDVFRFVAVGNFKKEKNYKTLISALGKVKKYNKEVKLDIYGSGVGKEETVSLIEKLGLEENIKLIEGEGYLHKRIPEYDCFIAASTFEGFGIALVEAMALGLPCVVSEIPSFIEITDHKAIYFDPYSDEDLCLKMRYVLNNKSSLPSLGLMMRKESEKFRKQIYLNKLVKEVYN